MTFPKVELMETPGFVWRSIDPRSYDFPKSRINGNIQGLLRHHSEYPHPYDFPKSRINGNC